MARISQAKIDLIINDQQAQQTLRDLATNYKSLQELKMKALKSGDVKTFNKLDSEASSVAREINKLSKQVVDVENVLKNLNKVSLKDLRAASMSLKNSMQTLSRDSVDYKNKAEQLVRVQNEIARSTGRAASQVQGFGDKLKNYVFTFDLGSIIYKMQSQLSRSIDAYAEYDDKLADVMKTTGLSKEATEELSESLSRLDTRTAQNELLDLAKQAGKLGISARDDVEAFTIAADKIGVSLGEDLGDSEQAINSIGKLSDLFKIEDEYGMADAMLKIGSAVNSLGAASTANEGYIVNFTSRTGGIGVAADIAITDIMGLGAAFDSLNQPAEASSTVINSVISGMFSKTAQYAKVAGLSVKEFSTILKTDANEALLLVLEGFSGADLGYAAKMLGEVGENGARAARAVTTIADSIESVREQQRIANEEFAKGTSILDEFNTKNNTEQAIIEKQKKEFQSELVELGRSLAPIFNAFLQGATTAMAALRSIITVIVEYKGVIAGVALAIGIYNVQKKLSAFYSSANSLALLRESYLCAAHTTAMKAGTATTLTYTLGQKALIAVKAALALQFGAARIAAGAFFKSIGPIGWVITAVGALAAGLSFLGRETEKTSSAFTEMSLQIASENQSYKTLKQRLDQTKEGTAERADLIATINTHYKEYLSNLLTEKSTTEEIAAALDQATTALQRNIREKVAAAEAEKAEQVLFDKKKEMLEELLKEYDDFNTATQTEKALVMQQLSSAINYITDYAAAASDATGTARRLTDAMQYGGSDPAAWKQIPNGIREAASEAAAELMEAANLYNSAISQVKVLTAPYAPGQSLKKPGGDGGDGDGGDGKCKKCGKDKGACECYKGDDKTKQAWTLESDTVFAAKRTALKKQLLNGQIATDEQYNAQILAAEISTLDARIKTGKDKGEQMARLQEQLLDKQLAQSAAAKKREEALLRATQGGEDEITKTKREYDEKRRELGLYQKDVADMTAGEKAAQLQLEREHNRKLSALVLDAQGKKIADLKQSIERKLTTQRAEQNEELFAADTFEKKKELIAKLYSGQKIGIVTSEEEAIKLIRAKYAQQNDDQLKGDLEQMLKTYQKVISQIEASGGLLDGVMLSEEDQQKYLDIIAKLREELNTLRSKDPSQKTEDPKNKADIFGFTQDEWEKLFENIKNGENGWESLSATIEAMGGAVASAMSSIFDLMNAIEEKDFKTFEKSQNQKKKSLDKQLKSGQIAQEAYNEKVQQLDEQTDAKRIEMERKQAERQKTMAIFNAIISTAVAVATALGSSPPPANFVFAGIVAALGAIQIAAIAAQPLPGAEQGGMLVERTQDGKRFDALYEPQRRGAVDRPTVLVGENGTEYVVPADGYSNPTVRPVLDMIEQARRSGQLKQINLPALMAANTAPPVAGRSSGGYISQQSSPDTSAAGGDKTIDPEIFARLMLLLDSLDSKLPYIKAVVCESGRDGLFEAIGRRDRLLNRSKL